MILTAYISGHLDLTEEEFKERYIPLLDFAIENKYKFLVGDAKGADTMAQLYLQNKTEDVAVFHMFESPRNNAGNYGTVGGFKNDLERDKAMTLISNYDIAWIRPGKEKSGTAKNVGRRMKKILINYTINGTHDKTIFFAVVNANNEIDAKSFLKNWCVSEFKLNSKSDVIIHASEDVSNKQIFHLLSEESNCVFI